MLTQRVLNYVPDSASGTWRGGIQDDRIATGGEPSPPVLLKAWPFPAGARLNLFIPRRFLPHGLAFVDIEAIGGPSQRESITEIGIVEVSKAGVREWSTLVRPCSTSISTAF